ncbi:MAG: class I adenylate-forming enzyme family protein [Bacteroidia bacterium]
MLFTDKLLTALQNLPPDKPALVKNGHPVFPEEIFSSAHQLAIQLQKRGMVAGDKVVIASAPGQDFLIIIYALVMVRAVVAIIDPEMGRENYQAKLRQFAPGWGFVDSRLLLLQEQPLIRWLYFRKNKKGLYFPRFRGLKVISTGPFMPLFQAHIPMRQLKKQKSQPEDLHETSPDQPFLITYTSGTISEPKGVVHTLGSLQASIGHIVRLMGNPEGQRVATHLPSFMLMGLSAAIPVYLWDYSKDAAYKLDFIEKNHITILFGPPSDYLELIQHCEKTGRKLPESLEHVMLGSAPVYPSFLEKLINYLPSHTRITALYGMTEHLLVATIDGREKARWQGQGDNLGKPVEETEVTVNEEGEILVRSAQLFTRYWHLEERETPHRSGDLGYFDTEGNLILTGRKKDMIIRRNMNIYPGLYEPTINKIPGITEAVMVGVYSEEKFDEVVYLIVEAEKPLTEAEIMQQLRYGKYSIDQEALPDHIIFRTLPRSGRQNKVDRQAIRREVGG